MVHPGAKRTAILLIAVLVLGWGLWQLYRPSPASPDLATLVDRVDHILIEKSARRLTASRAGQKVLQYDIALGFDPIGDKSREGDGKTPEGLFTIDRRNPNSSYHLSLGITYPQPKDIRRAAAAGIDPGGDIFIHGQPNALGNLATLPGDWTAGCIAISNTEMEQLWRLVDLGTSVEIRP
ncbi:L,D-transpeptidase family protein [Pseudophaeobacter arcticus]|uniref:L,D-transpeptidase family protein n=1 Tax=Pseudophaeobacter arcticus TaxID=385492 RepID=UPI003A96F495